MRYMFSQEMLFLLQSTEIQEYKFVKKISLGKKMQAVVQRTTNQFENKPQFLENAAEGKSLCWS